MSTIDRRSTPRVAVEVDVRLARAHGTPVPAQTTDLGAGGMRIRTARPLRVDEVLHFDLALDGGRPLEGDARVMRLHPRNHYALRFERLAPADSDAIARFVASH